MKLYIRQPRHVDEFKIDRWPRRVSYMINRMGVRGSSSLTPDANGEAVITHNLDEAVSFVSLTLSGDHNYKVDHISDTTTTLTVRISDCATGADVTTGTYTVYWEVKPTIV